MADNTDDNSVAEEISVAEETALLGDDENGNTESQEITMQGSGEVDDLDERKYGGRGIFRCFIGFQFEEIP